MAEKVNVRAQLGKLGKEIPGIMGGLVNLVQKF